MPTVSQKPPNRVSPTVTAKHWIGSRSVIIISSVLLPLDTLVPARTGVARVQSVRPGLARRGGDPPASPTLVRTGRIAIAAVARHGNLSVDCGPAQVQDRWRCVGAFGLAHALASFLVRRYRSRSATVITPVFPSLDRAFAASCNRWSVRTPRRRAILAAPSL